MGLKPPAPKSGKTTTRKRKKKGKSTAVPPQRKKVKVFKSHDQTLGFQIGDSVSAMWYGETAPEHKGQYFPGHIKSINEKKETMTVEFDDGDIGKDIRWEHVYIM